MTWSGKVDANYVALLDRRMRRYQRFPAAMTNAPAHKLTPLAAEVLLQAVVRDAISIIRQNRSKYEVIPKADGSGEMTDLTTTADLAAQSLYSDRLRAYFPGCGFLAEEGSKTMSHARYTAALAMYFTVDPLDGTKAFTRGQSHGVATMIALIQAGKVVAAYVGDVNTQEIYGYGPKTDVPLRYFPDTPTVPLQPRPRPLIETYVLLREPPDAYTPLARGMLGRFKSYEVCGGSIGCFMARLWKGEVGAVLIPKGNTTPWDLMPVRGISDALGFVFFRQIWNDGWEVWPLESARALYPTPLCHDVLVIHERDAGALELL